MSLIWIFLAVATFVAAATLVISNYISGETFVRDRLRARKVRKIDIAALDRLCAERTDRSDVIVSLSTIPSRVPHIAETLKSLLLQKRLPQEIRLNIPAFSRREKRGYDIPAWLTDLKMVRIVSCEDFGPATKFIPTLLSETQDQLIVIVDDDRIYPDTLIANLERAAQASPDTAFGTCGWVVPKDMVDRATNFSNLFLQPPAPIQGIRLRRPKPVDILKGVGGYAIRPRFFPLDKIVDYSDAPEDAFFVDDVWMSGYCDAPKFVIPTQQMDFHPKGLSEHFRSTSLGKLDPEKARNTVLLKYFGPDRWHVGGPQNL